MPTSAKSEDADAEGPTLREQMLEASAGALKKKKAARAKVQKKRFVYVFVFIFETHVRHIALSCSNYSLQINTLAHLNAKPFHPLFEGGCKSHKKLWERKFQKRISRFGQ